MTERLTPSLEVSSAFPLLAYWLESTPHPQAPRPAWARGSAPPDRSLAGGPRGACGPGVDSRGPGEGGQPGGTPRPPGAGGHRRPRACGPSGCRGRCAWPPARPRAQLLFKGPAGHVSRTQLAAAPAGAPRLGGSAPPPPPPPRRAGPREESRGARDAGSHGRSGARPGKRPTRGRPAAPGRRVGPRGSRPGGAPSGSWLGLLSAASAPRPRVRPARAARLPSSRPRLGRPKRQAMRGGWAAPTSGEPPDFAVTLKMTSPRLGTEWRSPPVHCLTGGPAARRQAGGWGGGQAPRFHRFCLRLVGGNAPRVAHRAEARA